MNRVFFLIQDSLWIWSLDLGRGGQGWLQGSLSHLPAEAPLALEQRAMDFP